MLKGITQKESRYIEAIYEWTVCLHQQDSLFLLPLVTTQSSVSTWECDHNLTALSHIFVFLLDIYSQFRFQGATAPLGGSPVSFELSSAMSSSDNSKSKTSKLLLMRDGVSDLIKGMNLCL